MEEERCELTDLLISQCGHCNPSPELEWVADKLNPILRPVGEKPSHSGERGRGLPFMKWAEDVFEAKMPDTCVSCGGRIQPGDRVRKELHYNTGVIHAECP